MNEGKLNEVKSSYCRECGSKISNKAIACPKCGAPTNTNTITTDGGLNIIALMASFFIPGLGQIVKGHLGRGIIIFILYIVGLCLFIIPGLFVWGFAFVDAYLIPKKVN